MAAHLSSSATLALAAASSCFRPPLVPDPTPAWNRTGLAPDPFWPLPSSPGQRPPRPPGVATASIDFGPRILRLPWNLRPAWGLHQPLLLLFCSFILLGPMTLLPCVICVFIPWPSQLILGSSLVA
jgi:hypothetical protein